MSIPIHDITSVTHQSPPLDFTSPIKQNADFVKGKAMVITGGASGFGAGFLQEWASYGATVIIGDTNVRAGEEIIAKTRLATSNNNLHFVHLDVTSWQSQVAFFKEAVRLSPHGGIDTVVANAGINNAPEAGEFESPGAFGAVDFLNDANPPKPTFTTLEVNLTGVLYTTYLARWYLPRNPGSKPCFENTIQSPSSPGSSSRDRHLILISSIAGLYPLVGQVPYTASKHAVIGIYRSLRMTAPITSGIRVNLLCPYFMDTPILNTGARLVLSGTAVGVVNDVVQAGTYFASHPETIGRAVVIGPEVKVKVPVDENGIPNVGGVDGFPEIDDIFEVIDPDSVPGNQKKPGVVRDRAVWEVYAHDFQQADLFTHRIMMLINAASAAKGWLGFARDVAGAFMWPVKRLLGY